MNEREEVFHQTDLWSLLPGVRGGRALLAQRGRAHMQAIGQKGGCTTRERYGRRYFQALGQLGRQIRQWRRARCIRVLAFLPGDDYKLIPYFPANRRRKHPLWVRFPLNQREDER
jgi:hypothetical protein